MTLDNKTLSYYEKNADTFIKNTINAEFAQTQDEFLELIPDAGLVLDFGCGSGRDSKYFLEKGYRVEAIDGSAELCKLASEYTGIEVKHEMFSDLSSESRYDGIWACASILHLPKDELQDVLGKMVRALKDKGYIYTSFKYGNFEGYRNERYFTDFTEGSFKEFIDEVQGVVITKMWTSADVRPDRGDERWLNLILQKLNTV